MYRIRRNRKRWQRRWPWRRTFRPKVNDRYCSECGLAYQDGPMPQPDTAFRSNSVEVLKFPAGTVWRKESVFRVVRLRATDRRFRYSDYVSECELIDVVKVLLQAYRCSRGDNKILSNRRKVA